MKKRKDHLIEELINEFRKQLDVAPDSKKGDVCQELFATMTADAAFANWDKLWPLAELITEADDKYANKEMALMHMASVIFCMTAARIENVSGCQFAPNQLGNQVIEDYAKVIEFSRQ